MLNPFSAGLANKSNLVTQSKTAICRKQRAHKSLHIHTGPNTLTLHLKRFRPDFIKLTGHIAFPLKLDLSPYLSPDSPDLPPQTTGRRVMYRLIAVLIHTGAWSCAGHYFAYVLDSGKSRACIVWLFCLL